MATVETTRRRFTVADYAAMCEVGIIGEEDRVELIHGEVRMMSPIGPTHAGIVKRLNRWLSSQVGNAAIVAVQDPVEIPEYDAPQPDLALLRPRDDFYTLSHPTGADVLLVIEVADHSLLQDRNEKIPIYAAGGIPEAWLVNIPNRTIEHYAQLRRGSYTRILLRQSGDVATAEGLPAVKVAVDELFGLLDRR